MRKMKDSGVEWIGEIPEEWEVLRNKNAFTCNKVLVGKDSSRTQLLSLTTKGIKEKDINDAEGKLPETFDTYQYVKKDNMVMCLFDLDCSAVFSGLSPYNGMISPAYKVLECKDNIDPVFADYWFMYIADGRKFNHYAKNIRYTLNYEEFSSLPIIVPSLEEQIRVSAYLDRKCAQIDSILSLQQAAIEKLKEYKLSLITEAVTKGLEPDAPMKDSGIEWIGEVPAHWEKSRIKNEFDNLDYLREPISAENRVCNDKTYDYYGASGVIDKIDYYNVDDKVLLIGEDGANLQMRNLPLIYRAEGKFWVNNHAHILKVHDNCSYGYMAYLLEAGDYTNYITGSTQPKLSQANLMSFRIVVPPVKEQIEIEHFLDDKCEKIDSTIVQKQSLISHITAYKKSLIYEVVTGKKEV